MDDEAIFDILRNLAETPGPVGREDLVQKVLEAEWKDAGFTTSFDKVGNLFGEIKGDGLRWAVVGHADSIGFLVQQILPGGFLKVAFNTAATTPDARFLAGVPLKFMIDGGTFVNGIFGLRSGHIAGIEGKKEPILFDDLFVDLGVDSEEKAKDLGIDVGTPAVFDTPVVVQGKNIIGPSMDNRVAGAIQVALAREIKKMNDKPNLSLISTVQEEIGMKGAAAAAKNNEFDAVINLDVGLVGDIPATKNDGINTKLGSGPIIVYKDFSIHYSSELIQKIEKIAVDKKNPFQKAVFKNYRTDGMHFFMAGMPTCMLAVPCRYTHTHFETIRIDDLINTLSLISAILLP